MTTTRFPRKQAGYSLIEVMIAVLILGIGLLGIAAMQATALKNSGSSMERSQAVIQTYTYIDVLRANRSDAIIGKMDLPLTCDLTNLASSLTEQRAWIQNLHDTLGDGSCGQATCVSDHCTVTVQWDDSRAQGGNGNAAQQLVTETLL